MKSVTTVVSAAALALALAATGATASGFSTEPTFANCSHLKKKVSDALQANAQSTNYKAASTESRHAQTYCNAGLYKYGVAGYAKALELLGVS